MDQKPAIKKPALSFTVLNSRPFRLLMLARMFGIAAVQAQAVIVGWQIYMMTRDPLLLGLTGLVEAVPAIVCALFAGYIVDNSRPQRVFFRCLAVLTLNTVFLFLLGSGLIPVGTGTFLILVYSAIFVSGVARAFIMPASFSLLAQIIPRKDIASASAWLSSGFQAAVIVAPAVAGLIYGGYGAFAAWLMPASLMLVATALMFFINVPHIPRPAEEKREPALTSIREGWRFILKSPILLTAMALDMLAVLFGGAVALLPAFAEEILNAGAEGLGAMRAAPAIGAIATALFLAMRPMKDIRMTTLLWMVVGFGVSMIGFGVSKTLWLSLLFLALSGAFDSVSMVIRGTLMQLLTPDRMRGRVSSVNSMFIISSNEIGAFESGALAKLIGLVPAVVIGGAGTLAVAGWTALFKPALRKTVVRTEDAPPAS